MVTVALVGGDGAGKTTIANILEKSFPDSFKYLYMGTSLLSPTKTLPTSRIARYLKRIALRKDVNGSGKTLSEYPSSSDFHYTPLKFSVISHALRVINRIAEATYRIIISLGYQLRGYVVIYDRHFLFSVNPPPNSRIQTYTYHELVDYLEYLFFTYIFPKPNLVIFLDAPAEVLYLRKREANIALLKMMRETILSLGKRTENFFQIDATQSIERVLAEVTQVISKFCNLKKTSNSN
jgi:thymidylate kinase